MLLRPDPNTTFTLPPNGLQDAEAAASSFRRAQIKFGGFSSEAVLERQHFEDLYREVAHQGGADLEQLRGYLDRIGVQAPVADEW